MRGGLCLHTLLLLLILLLGLSNDAESPENAHRGAKHTSSRVLWWRTQHVVLFQKPGQQSVPISNVSPSIWDKQMPQPIKMPG